ncbi:MAG: L-ribulose-5-phosphate 4-epimerase [Clostridia bacterium]|nr:L-ribulose-5-phosphate 4-epimerase [Clostridia bacterium]
MEQLKKDVYKANMLLPQYGLAPFTWGNASGIDRETGIVVIKPSGVPYPDLSPEMMVCVNLDGEVVEGELRPSSDTPTHIELYKAFSAVGGVVHTHSKHAVAFAQAGRDLPAYGTTHADFAYGNVPCTPALTDEEIEGDYEKNTGIVIVRCFTEKQLDYNAIPAALVRNHGPFTWGKNPAKAAENSAVLEIIAEMAINTELLAGGATRRVGKELLKKHYLRKHGANAYYGQKG